jgi:hypothetical protein
MSNEEVGDTSRLPSAKELLARAQELVDDAPAEGGRHSPEWTVPAYFLGDLTALAIATLRSDG